MSHCKLFALATVLMLGACMDGAPDEADPTESTIDQAVEDIPNCLPGETLVYWTENLGCNTCTQTLNRPGAREYKYAACSGNIHGTRAIIASSCLACSIE